VILHPTDFSERSDAALQVARTLASDLGARLVIQHVGPPELLCDGTAGIAIDPLVYHVPLEELRERICGRDLKHSPETRLDRGHAANGILTAAGELGCDLIVMGTHGRTGLRRLLVGSVAEAVLRSAGCPVLFVKTPSISTAAAAQPQPTGSKASE
jgi:nucleotide-binding universal stress UspA family protein